MGSLAEPLLPPLLRRFRRLYETIPWRALGNMPTPIGRLDGLCQATGHRRLFIKRDDVSGPLYGGNKVRKLEFLLADALAQGAVRVLTSGAAGSNHALATALYAKSLGLKCTLILFDQPPSDAVRANLLMDLQSGADMIYVDRYEAYDAVVRACVDRYGQAEGRAPYVIPPGGSSAIGVLGYVNAAVELHEQVTQGLMPEPGTIVVPFGTMGTVAGLALGCSVCGMHCVIRAVRVVPSSLANQEKCRALIRETASLLRAADPSFPESDDPATLVVVDDGYFEPGYGLASRRVEEAIASARATDGLELDATYSGKAFAAFRECARACREPPLLFWDTKNSRPLVLESRARDFRALPQAFHRFFVAGSAADHDRR